MADLHLELLRRNARLRAWHAYGLPVEGGWRSEGHDEGAILYLDLVCRRCGAGRSLGARMTALLAEVERHLLEGLSREEPLRGNPPYPPARMRQACSHLAPLLGEDPPGVRALFELELLAGE